MSIELPKDAEGREIPLDTNVLYDQDGNPREVARFAYTPSRDYDRWDVIFVDGYDRYASEMLLELPDSWSKLEEDLDRASRYDIIAPSCRYFTAGKCVDCRMRNGATCGIRKNERAFADILERIRNLRGEDDA